MRRESADARLPNPRTPQNSFGHRILWQYDVDADSSLEAEERLCFCHDERWRPVATYWDDDADPKEQFVHHAAGQRGLGGSSYIDSVILRDRDNYTGGTPNGMTSASDGTLEERRYYCQNWRADVVAVTKSDGTPIEYVRYSAYGEPTVYPVADLNMDGVVDSTDSGLWSDLLYSTSNASVYADTDLDWDGADDQASSGIDSDLFYESYNANLGLGGTGRVSSPGVSNRTGYAGYQWDQTLGAYHVRYRVYLPDIGRWTRRDPLGYVGGLNCFEYAAARPILGCDASGLLWRPVAPPPASRDCGIEYIQDDAAPWNRVWGHRIIRWIVDPGTGGGTNSPGFRAPITVQIGAEPRLPNVIKGDWISPYADDPNCRQNDSVVRGNVRRRTVLDPSSSTWRPPSGPGGYPTLAARMIEHGWRKGVSCGAATCDDVKDCIVAGAQGSTGYCYGLDDCRTKIDRLFEQCCLRSN